jgi:septum formation protein
MKLILASNSWIRRKLLDSIGIQYTADPPNLDEDIIKQQHIDARELVTMLAIAKAKKVAEKYKGTDAIIIACDSVNMRDGITYGKPKSKGEAFAMIKAASNSRDTQVTGYCVINAKSEEIDSGVEELHMDFLPISDTAIHTYLVNEPKAYKCSGGFHIGSALYLRHCARIEGSHGMFHAIPLEKIIPILQKHGLDM